MAVKLVLRNYSVVVRIFALLGVTVVFAVALVGVFWAGFDHVRRLSIAETQDVMLQGVRDEVRVATHAMAGALSRALAALPEGQNVNDAVRDVVEHIRYEADSTGYFFVYRGTVNVALPTRPEWQGLDLGDLHDANGVYYVRDLSLAAQSGGGFVEYIFPKPTGVPERKLSYAEMVPDTDLWVGTGVYVDGIERRKERIAAAIGDIFRDNMAVIATGFAVLSVVLCIAGWVIARSIMRPVVEAAQAAERIADGGYDIALDEIGRDEPARLSHALNRMAARLRHDIREINARREEAQEKARLAESALRDFEEANREVLRQIAHRVTSLQKMSMSVAHQLRNPMSIIAGFARILHRKDDAAPRRAEYLDGILEAAGRIERITTAVAEYAEIRLGSVTSFGLGEAVEEARAVAERTAAALSLPLAIEVRSAPVELTADRALVVRALVEVLENAVQALAQERPEVGPQIVVAVTAEGESVMVEIADNGPGIAPDDLPYVFDPFFTTKPQAVGMGLTRVERIIQEHGGEVAIESEPGRGVCVSIRLPLGLSRAGEGAIYAGASGDE